MNILKILIFSIILLLFVVPNVACIRLSARLYETFPELLMFRNALVESVFRFIPKFNSPFS